MGNSLSCCLCPNASPKVGRRRGSAKPDYEFEVYKAAAGNAVAVAPAAATVEPAELDFAGGEGHHLQHISDREMPEGKKRLARLAPRGVGAICSRAYLWPPPPPGSPGRETPPRAPSCPELALPGLGTGDEGWLCLASPPLILYQSRPASLLPSSLPECPILSPVPISQPGLRPSNPQPFLFVVLFNISWDLAETFWCILSFLNENLNTLTSAYPSRLPIQMVPKRRN